LQDLDATTEQSSLDPIERRHLEIGLGQPVERFVVDRTYDRRPMPGARPEIVVHIHVTIRREAVTESHCAVELDSPLNGEIGAAYLLSRILIKQLE